METVIRVTIIYLFVLLGLRVLGKREFGQLSPMELVVLLLIPELASQGLVREDFSITNALIGISALFILVFLTSFLTHISKSVEQVIQSSPTVLAYNGELVHNNLAKERVSPEEVFSEMHKAGIEQLQRVRWAILESDGKIAIIPHAEGVSPKKTQEDMVL